MAASLAGQAPVGDADVLRLGPGITPPRVLRKVEPVYSQVAKEQLIQGTVMLQIVVDEQGRATRIEVVSPLGFGLDEQAQAAVSTWEFAPALKDGKPVKLLAMVEVNFRMGQGGFDAKTETRRTQFNVALQRLKTAAAGDASVERSVQSILELSRQKFPAAMYAEGMWKITGEHLPEDPSGGLELIQKAAEKKYAPALYQVALRQIEGRDLPRDAEKGWEQMLKAANLGSSEARYFVGHRYEKGTGVAADVKSARKYFRLCAVQGVAECQYRLGKLLLEERDRPEREYIQAVAFLQLAGEQGLKPAQDLAAQETEKLTPAQGQWMLTLKTQLRGR